MRTDSQKLYHHYKGFVINVLFTAANTLCASFPMSPARGFVNVILCWELFLNSLETRVLEDRMSLSNIAKYSLWASVICGRTARGRERERVKIMKGGNETKKDNKRDNKKLNA
jgi:hypothetical protein